MARYGNNEYLGRAVGGGVVAGIAGGIVLSLLLIALTVSAGGDVWQPLKGAGAPFLGDRAAAAGFDAVAVGVGLISHFVVSIAWGVLFALLVFGLDRMLTLLLGAAWGVVVWLGMFYVVLPLVGLGAMRDGGNTGVSIAAHVVFGLAVGIAFLPFQVPRRRALPPPRTREPVTP